MVVVAGTEFYEHLGNADERISLLPDPHWFIEHMSMHLKNTKNPDPVYYLREMDSIRKTTIGIYDMALEPLAPYTTPENIEAYAHRIVAGLSLSDGNGGKFVSYLLLSHKYSPRQVNLFSNWFGSE